MHRNILLIICCVLISGIATAQISDRDSLWINDIVSGGGEYKLNDETIEAIRTGRFINSELFNQRILRDKSMFDLGKDELIHSLNIYHVSPTEALLYRHMNDSLWIVGSAILTDKDNLLINGYYKFPHSNVVINASDDWVPPMAEELNNEWQGRISPRTYVTFSAEDSLEDLLEPTERQKRENRKNANAWKYYNLEDMDD